MKFKYLPLSIIFIIVFTQFVTGKNKREPLSAKQLKQYATSINIPGTNFKTFVTNITMALPLPLNLVCQIRYEAPNNYALRVFDLADNTPFLIVGNNKGMIYNPSTGEVTYIPNGGALFELTPAGENFNANFAINLPVENVTSNKFQLDFESMFERINNNIEIVQGNHSDTIILKGETKQKGWAKAIFNLSNIYKLQQIEVAPEGSKVAMLSFKDISANSIIASNTFQFPEKLLRKSGLKINEISSTGFMDKVALFNAIMKMMFTRVAIQTPKVRESIEKMLHLKPNWEEMKVLDEKNSKVLKTIFKPLR